MAGEVRKCIMPSCGHKKRPVPGLETGLFLERWLRTRADAHYRLYRSLVNGRLQTQKKAATPKGGGHPKHKEGPQQGILRAVSERGDRALEKRPSS